MVGAARHWQNAARLAAAPLLLAAVAWMAGPAAVLEALGRADGAWLLAGLACSLVFNLLSALRWRHLVRWLGHEVSTRWALAVSFRAMALGSVLPGATLGGDLLRAWHLRSHGCPGGAAGLSVLLDRLSGLWMLWALAAAGVAAGAAAPGLQPVQQALGLPDGTSAAPLGLGAVAVVMVLPLALLSLLATRQAGGRLAALLQRPGPLQAYAWQATASLAAQAFSVASFACAARAFGVGVPMELIAATAAPIFLAASLPISFGGWGTRELATVAAWSVLGVAAPQAAGASLAFGGYALAQAVLGVMAVPRAASPRC
jgi:hypothetical protein